MHFGCLFAVQHVTIVCLVASLQFMTSQWCVDFVRFVVDDYFYYSYYYAGSSLSDSAQASAPAAPSSPLSSPEVAVRQRFDEVWLWEELQYAVNV